jgi:hypothetical protein
LSKSLEEYAKEQKVDQLKNENDLLDLAAEQTALPDTTTRQH